MTFHLSPERIDHIITAILFAGVVGMTLFGAVIAAASRRLVYSVSGLALSFVGLAGLYFFLNSPFLALMQILIYVGAVCVTIMFALMLADPRDEEGSRPHGVLIGVASLLLSGVLGAALVATLARSTWMKQGVQANTGSVKDIGRALLNRNGFAFELISVVLLLAILGALVVARTGRRNRS